MGEGSDLRGRYIEGLRERVGGVRERGMGDDEYRGWRGE